MYIDLNDQIYPKCIYNLKYNLFSLLRVEVPSTISIIHQCLTYLSNQNDTKCLII